MHLASASDISSVAIVDDPLVERLMTRFWPGPLTMVLPRTDAVPGIVTSGLPSVAVRVPSHTVTLRLIAAAGCPVAAPSANRFGSLSPTRASHVQAGLGEHIDLIVDGGPTTWGVESTIVSVVDGAISVLRLGAITLEELSDVASSSVSAPSSSVAAPGQLEQHYSPNTRLNMINRGEPMGDIESSIYIAFNTRPANDEMPFRILSPGGDLREAAARLFDVLHELDVLGAKQIIVEWMPDRGLGRVMNDRLSRAAAKFR